jgi:hypothetical protein
MQILEFRDLKILNATTSLSIWSFVNKLECNAIQFLLIENFFEKYCQIANIRTHKNFTLLSFFYLYLTVIWLNNP